MRRAAKTARHCGREWSDACHRHTGCRDGGGGCRTAGYCAASGAARSCRQCCSAGAPLTPRRTGQAAAVPTGDGVGALITMLEQLRNAPPATEIRPGMTPKQQMAALTGLHRDAPAARRRQHAADANRPAGRSCASHAPAEAAVHAASPSTKSRRSRAELPSSPRLTQRPKLPQRLVAPGLR